MNPQIWKILRTSALEVLGNLCANCGQRTTRPHVDHILPRSQFPHLALDPHNVQVLCPDCNRDKSDGVFSYADLGPNKIDQDTIRLRFIDRMVVAIGTRQVGLDLIAQAKRQQSRNDNCCEPENRDFMSDHA